MGPLLLVYVSLSALNFQFVTACQDGKLAPFFCFIIIFLAFIASLGYCLFLALTLLLA